MTRNDEQLAEALVHELAFIDAGGDVRRRAELFLHFHCNTAHPKEPADLAASAIADVVLNPRPRLAFKAVASGPAPNPQAEGSTTQLERPPVFGKPHALVIRKQDEGSPETAYPRPETLPVLVGHEKNRPFILMNRDSIIENKNIDFQSLKYKFAGFEPIERVTQANREAIMASAKCDAPYLATLIIGVRHKAGMLDRLDKLRFLLHWINHYYGDLFEVLIIEQNSEPQLRTRELSAKPYVRHAFIYNPDDYNRGWGYNVAVRHECAEAKVVVLMDTDVLTGANFVRDVIDCHYHIDVASPYLNIYYTNADEAKKVQASMSLASLNNATRITNPVTISGGIVIWKRSAYMALKGYEQYVGYGAEDRAMDVAILNHMGKETIRLSPATYVHMFHDKDMDSRRRVKDIFAHLNNNYGCIFDKSLSPFDFIHKNCKHVERSKTFALMLARSRDFGDPDLYRSRDKLAINGVRLEDEPVSKLEGVIFPPDFKGLSDYPNREVYANTPDPDSDELAQFYNRFKGQRCFIIGNGPSLNKNDLALLKNEYSFGVNSFYYKTRETGFRPTFYVVEDSSVMKENIEEIRAYEAPFKFFPTIYHKLHPKAPNTFFFNMNRGFYEKTSPHYAVPRFSTDASRVLYCGQSVTYINLQLAYFMGFTEVYLIGMDFNYTIPESHKRTGDVLLSDSDDPNHFHKDYFGKGKTWKDPKLDRVLMNYKMANLVYSSVGRKIYNATIGGHLEEFERVNYEGLFNGLDQSFKLPPPALTRPSGVMLPSVVSVSLPTKSVAPTPFVLASNSFAQANKLYREGNYAEALRIYEALAVRESLSIYRENAKMAKAKLSLV